MTANIRRPSQSLRWLSIAASVALFILVALGGVVRVTDSGLGCPSWPLCYGGLLPPAEVAAMIEFSHRLMAVIASVLILATGVVAVRGHRNNRAILVPAIAACVMLIVQVTLGAITVFMELSPVVVAIHLGVGLILLGCILVVATNAAQPASSAKIALPPELAPLAVAVMVSVFSVVVIGAIVTASGSSLACPGWPLCGDQSSGSPGVPVQMVHRLAVSICAILIVLLVVGVWRVRSAFPLAWTMVVNLAGVFTAQALIGGLNVLTQLAIVPREAHIAFGSVVWGLSVVIATLLLRSRTHAFTNHRVPGITAEAPLEFHHGRSS